MRWVIYFAYAASLLTLTHHNRFPYYQVDPELYIATTNTHFELRVQNHEYALGYMLPSVVKVFQSDPSWAVDEQNRILMLIAGNNVQDRSTAVMNTLLKLRTIGHFSILEKWRGEFYPVYGRNKELLFNVERSASPLFGVVTYGVHLNAYTRTRMGQLKIWTPRRAKTKQTYGGLLDNAVAGGIASGESPWECIIRECGEEASLPEDLLRNRLRACGTITYFHIRNAKAGGETGLLQPECQYIYDLELPEDVVLEPGDDEVEEFYLWDVDKVKEAMARGEFKPNCAAVVLDFFVRHSILTCETDNYIEIIARLHRKLEFPTL